MTKIMERRKEIEERKAALREEMDKGVKDEKRLKEIRDEARTLNQELEEIRTKELLEEDLKPGTNPVQRNAKLDAAEKFAKENRMSMPLFKEGRSLLVSTGNLVTPTGAATEIAELPKVVSSIIDDVDSFDATGTGGWSFPYEDTEASAKDTTEGNKLTGTIGTFNHVECNPVTWDVLGEVSNQVKKMTSINYYTAVRKSAYFALRKKAKEKVTAAVIASSLVEKVPNVKLDENYLRKIALGYGSDESVAGGTKLYINKTDLATLGSIRGTQDKKAVYDITYDQDDENNGIIKEGGTAIRFSINSSLPVGKQLYGKPKTIKMPMWGEYEISTDEGGEYFAKNVMAVRGLATANAVLAVKNGMQLIGQSTIE